MKRLLLLTIIFLFPISAFADFVTCEGVKISLVSIQADRDDDHIFSNKMIIRLKTQQGQQLTCGGKDYHHADITGSLSYASLMAAAIKAHSDNITVNVSINTSNTTSLSNQISVITMGN